MKTETSLVGANCVRPPTQCHARRGRCPHRPDIPGSWRATAPRAPSVGADIIRPPFRCRTRPGGGKPPPYGVRPFGTVSVSGPTGGHMGPPLREIRIVGGPVGADAHIGPAGRHAGRPLRPERNEAVGAHLCVRPPPVRGAHIAGAGPRPARRLSVGADIIRPPFRHREARPGGGKPPPYGYRTFRRGRRPRRPAIRRVRKAAPYGGRSIRDRIRVQTGGRPHGAAPTNKNGSLAVL